MFPSCLIILKAIDNRIKSWRECSFWFFLFCLGEDIEDIIWLCRDTRVFAASFLLVHFTLTHELLFFLIREEKFHISKGPCYVLFIVQTPISTNHFTFIFFCCVLPEFFQVKQILWRKLSSILEWQKFPRTVEMFKATQGEGAC